MPGPETLTRLLGAAEAAAPVDALEAVTREIADRLQARFVGFLVADTSGRSLVRMVHHTGPGAEATSDLPGSGEDPVRSNGVDSTASMSLDGGPLERVLRSQQIEVVPPAEDSAAWTVVAPVTERGEVIGLLELGLPGEPSPEDTTEIAALAHLLAFVVIANRRHTDLFEWSQRSRPLSLSAEIQQRLLPGPRTCEAGSFTLSGWLEPAADIAGDTFDYSLGRNILHLSMTDAMGHGVGAALTATLCVSAMRGARRQGLSLAEQAVRANQAVADHSTSGGMDDFVTGLVGHVELDTGILRLVNAGHVLPYLSRGGEVTRLDLPVNLPFGMFADAEYQEAAIQLQPEDRVVLVTDGMLERNAADIDLPTAILEATDLHPREAATSLADSVLAATGHALSDDATVLFLHWYDGHGSDRRTSSGADLDRASSPER